MARPFDYTAYARRFSSKFPFLSYTGIQINFWIVANVLLTIIMRLQILSISQTIPLPSQGGILTGIIVSIILGVVYGIIFGITDYYLDKTLFRKLPLGKIIVFKTILSLTVLSLFIFFLRFFLFDLLITSSADRNNYQLNDKSWRYLFYLIVVYYFFMTLVISFINQVNKKYGPGVLLPLLLGKYRTPQEEERIFMFMDLKSSTSIAEQLGHLKYSSFIRDSFLDINQVLLPFNAEVYQYVGDEIVITWRVEDGLRNTACLGFYFACQQQFMNKSNYYNRLYGFLPHFKAGVHMGKVTAVEIGEIKRDIAYHGDTLNTAARIQSVCNEYNKNLLISEYLLQNIGLPHNFIAETLGMIQLKGKTMPVGIASVANIG